jgi:hypothetical protein
MDIDQAIDRIHAATAGLAHAQAAVEAAKQTLHREALRALIDADGDEAHQQALAHRLYWDVPELPVRTLEAVLGSGTAVRRIAGPGPVLGACSGCGAELRATSRSERASGAARCSPCDAAHQAEWARRLAEQHREDVRHSAGLRAWEDDHPGWGERTDWDDEPAPLRERR